MGDLTAAGDFEYVLRQLEGFAIEVNPWENRIVLLCSHCAHETAAGDQTLTTLMLWAFRHTEGCPR